MSNSKLITINQPKSPISEAYRTLRTNIAYSDIDHTIKSLVVTSTIAGEGKSTLISNLAIVNAKNGKRVLLIDADLRKPNLHRIFELSNKSGLTNLLINYSKDNILNYTQQVECQSNLSLLTAGVVPPNPSELIGSHKMKLFIRDASELFDTILIDTPPVGIVTDAAILSTRVSGTLFVISYDNVKVELAQRAKILLDNVGANILGVALTKVSSSSKQFYGSYYYSEYYYGQESLNKCNRKENKKRKNK